MWVSSEKEHPFEKCGAEVSADMSEAIEWIRERSSDQVIADRERIISKIELLGEKMTRDGRRASWFADADPHVARVSEDVNGPLATWLAVASEYHDLEAIELFRKGADMVGVLEYSGLGSPIEPATPLSSEVLRSKRATRNQRL